MSLGIVYWQKKKPTKPVKTNSWHWPNNVAPYCVLHQCSVTGMWDFSISIYFATEARFKGPKIGYGLGIRAGLQWMKINLSTWQFIRWPDIDIVCTIWTWMSIIYFKCKAIVNRAIYHFKSWLYMLMGHSSPFSIYYTLKTGITFGNGSFIPNLLPWVFHSQIKNCLRALTPLRKKTSWILVQWINFHPFYSFNMDFTVQHHE